MLQKIQIKLESCEKEV